MTSGINVGVPANGADLLSAPIRAQFATAAAEISALQSGGSTSGLPLTGGTLTGRLTINTNTAPVAQVTPSTLQQWSGQDNTAAVVFIDCYSNNPSNSPVLSMRRAEGTGANPTSVNNGDLIGAINFAGAVTGQGLQPANCQISGHATEPWSTTAHGSELWFWTTPPGTNTITHTMTLEGTGKLSINRNTAPLATASPSTILQLNGQDGTPGVMFIDAYSGNVNHGPVVSMRKGQGTAANPTTTVNGDLLGALNFAGCVTGAGLQNANCQISGHASEGWTTTAHGAELQFWTTAIGTNAITNNMTLRQGLLVGNPTNGDMGSGTINASQIFVNGVAVATTAGGGGTMTSVTAGAGLATTPAAGISTAGSIALALVGGGLTAGSYTNTDLTVDQYGRITAAANGSGGPGGGLPLTGGTLTGRLTINTNAAPVAVVTPSTLQQWSGQDNTAAVVFIDCYSSNINNGPVVSMRKGPGTGAAPGTTVNGDLLGALNFAGSVANALQNANCQISGHASQGWSGTQHGAELEFWTTANDASAVITKQMVLRKGLIVGNATGGPASDGDMGPGTVNVGTGVYINGTAVTGGGGGLPQTGGTLANPSASTVMTVDNAGGIFVPAIQFRSSGNTLASPTPTTSNTQLGMIQWQGYSPSGYGGGANIQAQSAAGVTWTDANRPTRLLFQTTRTGQGLPQQAMYIGLSGGLVVGSPAGADQGAGTVNAENFYTSGTLFIQGTTLEDYIKQVVGI